MKTKCAFWAAGIGILLAAALRCIQMLYFFDDETGFVTDSGIFSWISSGIMLLAVLISGILCRTDRSLCGRLRPGANGAVGVTALFSALFLGLCSIVLFRDFYTYRYYGVVYFVPSAHVEAHLPFAVLSALFGIAMLISAVVWMCGKGFRGLGVLWALGILWGLCYMVLTFMTYSASATTVENFFTVGGGAALVFFLLAEGKLFAGIGTGASRDIYVFGLPAAVLWLTYVFSNTVLIIAGRGYATEMPYVLQLVMLFQSVHILALLFSLRGTNFEPLPAEQSASERKNGAHAS
ncbi:MAG: hypothetical protein ACI4GO_03680 [Hominenteromicrobium sp.]